MTMNVIDIQSTRAQKNKPAEASRDRYEKEISEKASQVPFYVGLSISALLLYLKSSLSPGAEAHDLEEAPHLPHLSPDTPVDENFVLGEGNSFDICKIEVPDSEHVPHKKVQYSALYPVDDYRLSEQAKIFSNDSLDLNIAFKSDQLFIAQSVEASFTAAAPVETGLGGTPSNDNGGVKTKPDVPVPPTKKPPDKPTPDKTRNHAPKVSGPVYLSDQFQCTVLMIAIADLLSHATDADAGDVLSVGAVKVNGVLLEQMNGQYFYHGEELGPVTITYLVTDGKLSVATSAIVNFVERDAINGTSGDDMLLGTDCEDTINGQAGDDRIDGRGGDDHIHGGLGNDMLVGGDGDDVIYGEDGNDRIFGGAGNDILFGGAGNDIIFGDDGNDIIDGGTGNDIIHDGKGRDHVTGGAGNDIIVAEIDNAQDMIDGGSGNSDKLSYYRATTHLEFDAAKGTVTTAPGVTDQFAQVEILQGGSGDDMIHAALRTGNAGSAVTSSAHETEHQETQTETTTSDASEHDLNEQAEDDQPHDQAADATSHHTADQGFTYIGGDGTDTLDYGVAKQDITINIVHGTAKGAELGTDFFESIEVFVSGSGDDHFIAAGHGVLSHRVVVAEADVPENTGSASVTLNAADESASHYVQESLVNNNQTFHGGEGRDTLCYSNGSDSITINIIQGTATGTDIGTDHFDGIEAFVGGQGDDVFIVGQMSTSLNGGGGNDMFEFVLATNSTSATTSFQHISGFEVGDWVRIAQYDVFENAETSDENDFQSIMDFIQNQNMSSGDNSVDAVVPIHIRYEQANGSSLTYIESDIDQDGKAEFSIVIDGAHHLHVIDHQHV